uniref:Uncharacterized protein n=1 Tax=uncultured marine crenarchaeote HF4000_APKG10I20 TaxID=455612 RepID=B3TCE7_9ARCH|nr:hypothetical protein ALOHA_HF4000APKG10I20ctg10g2 [uncultured marine crenarchaeote HF4000_APKG10I20]
MGRFNMRVFDVVFHTRIAVFHNLTVKLVFTINCLHKRNIDKPLVLGNHLFFMACEKCVAIHRNAEIDNTEVNCKCPCHFSNTTSDYG